jgi:hypothetical protein
MSNLLYSITQIILFALFLSNRQVRENNGGFYNCMSQCVTLIIEVARKTEPKGAVF